MFLGHWALTSSRDYVEFYELLVASLFRVVEIDAWMVVILARVLG